ncbi:MAG: hypothetical protein CMM07_03545 [Rhodopirellula sp.]|nr:hypothetical protein [Rhodopirellula sp.]
MPPPYPSLTVSGALSLNRIPRKFSLQAPALRFHPARRHNHLEDTTTSKTQSLEKNEIEDNAKSGIEPAVMPTIHELNDSSQLTHVGS